MFGYDVFGAPLIFNTDHFAAASTDEYDFEPANCPNSWKIYWVENQQQYMKQKNGTGGNTTTNCKTAQCVKDWFAKYTTRSSDCYVFESLSPEEHGLPVDCVRWQMGRWGEWSDCKGGKMTRTRSRDIKIPAANGGAECVENLTMKDDPSITWDVYENITEIWKPCDSDQTCTDTNRNTKSDGSCSATCKSGYDFDETDLCVAEVSTSNKWTLAGIVGGIGLLAVLAIK
jgi:hypothetical protein